MKHNLSYCLCAAILAGVREWPRAAQRRGRSEGLTPRPMGSLPQSRRQHYRLRNSIVSAHWSGYAVTASAPYASPSGTFQVPSVTHDGLKTSTEYVSHWVGVGGYGNSH